MRTYEIDLESTFEMELPDRDYFSFEGDIVIDADMSGSFTILGLDGSFLIIHPDETETEFNAYMKQGEPFELAVQQLQGDHKFRWRVEEALDEIRSDRINDYDDGR